jgi:drug/metabolite transporter (DMT)-like permease
MAQACRGDNAPMTAAATDTRRPGLDPLAVAVLLTCCTLWGLNQVAAKVAMVDIPPLWQAGVRSLGGALLVLGWAQWRGVPIFASDRTLRGGLLAGTLFAAEFACIFLGLQFTTASRMAVFIYLSPFVVALGMPWVTHGERLRPLQWTGLVIAFAGVAVAFAEGFDAPAAGDRQWIGDALGVGAALLWGATTLIIRATTLATAAPEKTLAYQLAISGVLLVLAALAAGERWPATMAPLSAGSMVFQTVIVTFASYLAWFWLMRHYPATRIAAFTLLTPVAGLAFGVLLLNEPLTWRLLTALAAVAAGLVLVNRR